MVETNRKQKILSFLEQDPASSFLLFALAKEYEIENDHQSSIETYERLIQNEPLYTGAYYHLGKQYILIDNPMKALEVYKAGLEACKKANAMHDASEIRSAFEEISDEEL